MTHEVGFIFLGTFITRLLNYVFKIVTEEISENGNNAALLGETFPFLCLCLLLLLHILFPSSSYVSTSASHIFVFLSRVFLVL